MGKKSRTGGSDLKRQISPVAKPLFDGKLLDRCVKLIGEGATLEEETRKKESKVKCIRRGVAEVTKALRKGEKGLVFLASDVHPIDIIAHLPVLCENKRVVYGYICDKQSLGKACASTRPSAVVMIVPNKKFQELYDKVEKAAIAANPFFDA